MTVLNNDDLADLLGFEFEPTKLPPARDAEPATPSVITTRGPGAQQAARDAGALYLIQTDPRGPANAYHGFATEAGRNAAAAAHIAAGLEVVERCDGKRPARPYIDVDASADATDAELATIAEAFAAVAAEWGAPADRLAPVVNACDRAAKRSQHLIADGWAVPDGAAVQRFALAVADRLTGRAADDKWVDRSGGRLSYGLRVAGCTKAGDASAALSGPLAWVQTAGDPVIDAPAERCAEVAAAAPAAAPDDQALARFQRRVAAKFPDVYELDEAAALGGGVVASFNRIAPGHCDACDKAHDRAGAYISQAADGSLFLRCRRTPKTGPALLSKLAKRPEPAAEPEPDPDAFDDLAADSFETVGGPGVYNEEAIGDDGDADLYAASAWGTGKSQHNAAIVRALLARNPRAIVLIVSCRRSLSAQLAHDISGAKLYDRIRGNLDPKATPVSVWQVDSLARVGPGVVPDLLIIDELNQLTAHAYQGGEARGKAAAGMSSLRALAQRARRVIVSDNDLTGVQVEAFRQLRPGKASRVVRNSFQPWAATTVAIRTGRKAPASVRAEMFAWLDQQRVARAAGLPWEAAAAPCHSLKVARGLAEEATQRYGAAAVRLYSSETDDGQKRRDFGDAGAAWDPADCSGPLLVIYTSTVSVGVSCPSARFAHCYAFFGAGNCAATTSAQMLFRCRKLRSVLVSYDGRARFDLPQQPADLYRWVTHARNLAALPDSFRHDRNPFIEAPTASDPDALAESLSANFEGSMWVANTMESNRSARWFVERLRRIIERAGMKVTVEAASGPVDAAALTVTALANITATVKRRDLMAGEMARRHAAAVDAAENGADPDEDRADRTAEDKAGDRARYIARDLGQEPAALAAAVSDQPSGLAEWLNFYEPIAPAYRRACRMVTAAGLGPRELASRSEVEADGVAREVFKALGAAPCAEAARVEPATLLAPAVVALCGRINTHASRLFDDKHGARRAKTLGGGQAGRQRQAAAATIGAVLSRYGAQLVPQYDSSRDKTRGTPSRWVIAWAWRSEDAPEPRPAHPREAPAAAATMATPPTPDLDADFDAIAATAAEFEEFRPSCGVLDVVVYRACDEYSDRALAWSEMRQR